jgi:NADH dehydrogenase [ubiquinone] 1 alpha subcomplex assembly factor 7
MSALQRHIVELIRLEGPISVERYMGLCLGHPTLGYYITRDPFGRAGDFITAPEISQTFGELLGLWSADCWARQGSPSPVRLVEFGPGRGTLMADALRAMRIVPGLMPSLSVHMIETSPVLREAQNKALAQCGTSVTWATDLSEVAGGALIAIANEFFDALPIKQFMRTERGWCERLVGLDETGNLCFGLAAEPDTALSRIHGPDGSIYETCPLGLRIMGDIARRIARKGGAAIIVDYGHARSGLGDTLQAVRSQDYTDVLSDCGDADLTAHVDFEALAQAAIAEGAEVHGPLPQGILLRELGIEQRMASLTRSRPDLADEFRIALERLTGDGEGQMGDLFKAMAVVPPGFGPPAAFDP